MDTCHKLKWSQLELKNTDEGLAELFSKDKSFGDAFKCLFENASDAIYILDMFGNFVAVNRKVEELTGFNLEDFIGNSFRKIVSARSLPKAIGGFLDIVRGKKVRLELELKTATNKIILAEVTSTPLVVNGKTVGTLGILHDVTERVLMERKLKETTKKLEMLFETAMEGIAVVDTNENITFANKAFSDMLGYREEELAGINLRKLLDEKGFKEIRRQTEDRKKGKTTRYELVLYCKDGEPRNVQVSASPLWNDDGTFAGSIGIVLDVTERKRTEEALRISEERFRKIFESANDSLIYLDRLGRILDINKVAEHLFGGSKSEVLGKHFIHIGVVSSKDIPTLLNKFAKILAGKETRTSLMIKNKKGQERYLECSSSITKIDDRIIGILVIARDVTERWQMQRKLEEYSQELEALVEKRTKQLKEAHEQLIKSERLAAIGQVAAMVGHDLRNPLTGIKSAAYYLKTKLGSVMDKKISEMLELIEKDVQYSNRIITDLLDYSREIKLELAETTPKSIIEDALSIVQIPKNVQVQDLTHDKPKTKMDINKMKRVFVNIIKNAVEAMPEGGRLTISGKESDGNVEIIFADTGIGIAKEAIEKIWSPFFTTKAKGLGLGLPICKRILEAHGGKISVESIVDEGATFTVTIPIEPKPKEEGGEKVWVNVPESLLSTTTRA